MTTMSRSAREANAWFQKMKATPKYIGREGVPKFTQFMNRLRSIAPTHGETLRNERRITHHGSTEEQSRRIAAARWKRNVKRVLRAVIKDANKYRASRRAAARRVA